MNAVYKTLTVPLALGFTHTLTERSSTYETPVLLRAYQYIVGFHPHRNRQYLCAFAHRLHHNEKLKGTTTISTTQTTATATQFQKAKEEVKRMS